MSHQIECPPEYVCSWSVRPEALPADWTLFLYCLVAIVAIITVGVVISIFLFAWSERNPKR